MANIDGSTARAVRLEAAKTKETADRMANGESTDEKDDARVLAGMVKQVAEQVERLAALLEESRSDDASGLGGEGGKGGPTTPPRA
jgi:hypothetical protein